MIGRPPAPCAATLHVETATVVFADADPGTPGRIQLEGRYNGFTVDPRTNLRLSIGDSVRWVTLRTGTEGQLTVRSSEHGYSVMIDPRQRRFTVSERDVLPGRENPVAIEFRQGPVVACTRIHFTEEAADRWTFRASHDRQEPCHVRETK